MKLRKINFFKFILGIICILGILSSCKTADSNHTHVWEDATCTVSKKCKECGQVDGKPLGHHGGTATCQKRSVCEACGLEYGDYADHDYSAATCTAPKTCKVCHKELGDTLSHHGGTADCEHKAKCEVCGTEYGDLGNHVWEVATCTTPKTCKVCGATEGVALEHHGGTADCEHKAKCEVCGLEYGDFGDHVWEAATCTTPKTCKVCGATEGVAVEHHGGTADCSHKAKCEVCGLEYGDFGDHVWEDATCTTPKTCKVCGATEGVAVEHHGGTADCSHKAICADCGLEYGGFGDHVWENATCTAPKTCKVCGTTEGVAIEHHGGIADCCNKAICVDCGLEYGEFGGHIWDNATCTAPKTCKVCGEIEGVALGHQGGIADCSHKAVCEVCNQEYGNLGDHVWKDITDGKQCAVCAEVVYNGALTGYYAPMNGHLDATFKQTLNALISSNLKSSSYSNVWTILRVADEDPNNSSNIICFYTGQSIPKANQDGSSSANVVWNREHVWAKSHGFGSDSSNYAYYDCHHLHATEKNINSTRGNLPFDDVTSGSLDSYGNSWSSLAFEPRDEVKGDVARSLFYMVVRYDDATLDLELEDLLTSTFSKEPTLGKLSTLLKWAKEDPVSAEEMARNEIVYQYQGNRNPFIDHPEWIDLLYPSSEPGPSDQPSLPTDITDKVLITDNMVTIPFGSITATGIYKITTNSGTIEINWNGYDGAYASKQEFGINASSGITFTMENETIYKLEADIFEYQSNIYDNMKLYRGNSSSGELIGYSTAVNLGSKTGNKYTYIIDGGATELYYYNTYTKAVGFYDIYLYTKQDSTPIQPDVPPVVVGEITENIVYDDFQVHFLELGNANAGDSVYIKAGGNDILIDAGSNGSSATTLYNYINQYCTDGILEYVIVTHSDTDHIAGMYGNSSSTAKNYKNEVVGRTGLMYYYDIENIIDFAYAKGSEAIDNSTATSTSAGANTNYGKYLAAREYAVSKGASYHCVDDCWNNLNGGQRTYQFTESISMNILYNAYYSQSSSDNNNYSVCTLFSYNDHHFLFTGDLELEGEQALANYYDGSTAEKTLPHCDLFKGGHHGSKTSSNDCLLSKITPSICCVCCCAGSSEYTANYKNMFPTQEFINRIAKYTDRVYITTLFNETTLTNESMNGNIIVSCDGQTIGLKASNNLTKLKDTTWFNETIYVVGDNHCSGAKKEDFYTAATANALPVVRRTWPN